LRAVTGLSLLCLGSSAGGEQVLERVWPYRRIINLHIANTPNAGFDQIDVRLDDLFRHPNLHAEHKLFSFAARLNLLGGELRLRGYEAHISSGRTARSIIDSDPRFRAYLEPCRLFRGKKDFHVDVPQIHKGEDLAASSHDLTDFGE